MTLSLAVLTPGPNAASFSERTAAAFARLRPLFAQEGISAFPWPWDQALDGRADAASAQLAWGYHWTEEAWRRRIEATSVPLINPKSVLLWNTSKTYLLELAQKGVPVVPTLVREGAGQNDLTALFDALETDALVIKPAVSAGGHSAKRLFRGDAMAPLEGSLLIQPFLNAVSNEGETSLFIFGGTLGHAVRKRPAPGEFRVQPRFGGTMSACVPDADMVDLAHAAYANAPEGVVYARIDLVRDEKGRPCLMELEAIEPDLYLECAEDGGALFARAVASALRRS